MHLMQSAHIIKLVISIALCQLAGVIGGLFTSRSVTTWYPTLKKPSFNPPDWVFGPVWISLYFLMGVSAYLVWRKGLAEDGVRVALAVFLAQLVLNSAWSVAFFGLRSPLSGVVVIAFLWIAIVATMILFSRVSTAAVILLVPYVVWVSFAAVLNTSIYVLNR